MRKLVAILASASFASVAPTIAGAASDEGVCVYPSVSTGELSTHPGCALLDDAGGPRLLPSHLEDLELDEDGYGWVRIDRQWYWVERTGEMLPVVESDNGPDPWSDGLTRTRRNGKIVYHDRDFQPAFPPRYDWGWPFEDGHALVCVGCAEGGPIGDHRPIVGGSWGYIDRAGREVVPVALSREEALALRPPRRGATPRR